MENQKENSAYCPNCQGFHQGTIEFVTSTHRKLHYNFICNFCLIPSNGFIILKKDVKKLKQ